MKQTLKIGQKYRVIKDCMDNFMNGKIVTVHKLDENNPSTGFYDKKGNCFSLMCDKLELIKPKTKKVKKWNKEDIEIFLGLISGDMIGELHGIKFVTNSIVPEGQVWIHQSQPIKEESNKDECELCGDRDCRGCPYNNKQEESKDIEKLDTNKDWDADTVGVKLNEVIDTLNSLTKRNIK